jgi:hypothetical protein
MLDPSRYQELLYSIMTFRTRSAPKPRDVSRVFNHLSCLDKFRERRDYDVIDVSRFKGEPYRDANFVQELATKMESYLTYFGYSHESLLTRPYVPAAGEPFPRTGSSAGLAHAQTDSTKQLNKPTTDVSGAVSGVIASQKAALSLQACTQLNYSVVGQPSKLKAAPPLIVSLPGSGGILLRKLIETATGLNTGSLGNSEGTSHAEMNELFTAEQYCGRDLAAVYCEHPDFVVPAVRVRGRIPSGYKLRHKVHQQRCGNIPVFNKMILLLRDPFEAMISAHAQRRDLADEAGRVFYADTDWIEHVKQSSDLFQQFADLGLQLKRSTTTQSFIVRYEDLTNPASDEYKLLMHKLVEFIASTDSNVPAGLDRQAPDLKQLRLSCTALMHPLYQPRDNVSHLKFAAAPYDRELLSVVSRKLQGYHQLFGYTAVNSELVSSRFPVLSQSELADIARVKQPQLSLRIDQHLLPISTVASDQEPVLAYSQPHGDYTPPLVPYDNDHRLANNRTTLASMRCKLHFGYRNFRLESDPYVPLLLSFAGSGNTWVRLLIEYATGIFSGSTDASDKALANDFIGERHCNKHTVVIKAHPPSLQYNQSVDPTDSTKVRSYATLVEELQRRKCADGDLHQFTRFVFLVRDPYAAIFAEVNRELTSSHSSAITVEDFLKKNWHQLIVQEAVDYQRSWNNFLSGIVKSNIAGKNGNQNMHIVRYEQLIDPVNRYVELYKATRFVNSLRSASNGGGDFREPSLERLECAFSMSDVSTVHRTKSAESMTAARLYRNKTLVDELWEYIKDFAVFAGYLKYRCEQ